MAPSPQVSPQNHPTALDGLLAATAALRSGPDLHPALRAVVGTLAESLGFATVALNLYRAATHDFEVVVVHGSAPARRALLGTTSPAEAWAPLFESRLERHGCWFVPEGELDWGDDSVASYVPELDEDPGDPDCWRAEDSLLVPLRAAGGSVLGVLSVDEPRTGRRPSDRELQVLAAVAAQAGLVIESAQAAQVARRHRADMQELLTVGTRMTAARSQADIAAAVCAGIQGALGFERVTLALCDAATSEVSPVGAVGWPGGAPAVGWPVPVDDIQRLLEHADPVHGCALLSRAEAHALVPESLHVIYSSTQNGRGPHGWDHHWLLVPLHGEDGTLLGVVWPDDPVDRLLPTPERLRTLRAFANQASTALEVLRSSERLRHLAEHDPLTGLRNRRGLHDQIQATIDAHPVDGVAVVVADADAFKRVNDELGYHTGDDTLRVIATTVGDVLPAGGYGARLGGEEFALVLPGCGEPQARAVAEALRRGARACAPVPWGLRLSAGVAGTGSGPRDAERLLRAATRALVAAKRLGRDRVVAYDASTIEPLLEALGREEVQDDHHLAAVLLLAETLDLRDAGTARHSQTVGRYARAVAHRLGFSAARVERMRIAGLLHDVGKLAVADAVLHKPGALDDVELAEIRRHPEVGARIVGNAGLGDVAEWVLAHHEHWDGSGYPRGLRGTAIPVEARVLAVADAYEAMTARRPYRPTPMTPVEAQRELRRHAGTQFDPDVVACALELAESG